MGIVIILYANAHYELPRYNTVPYCFFMRYLSSASEKRHR